MKERSDNMRPSRPLNGWKAVSIGETVGILLGAGVLHLVSKNAAADSAEQGSSDMGVQDVHTGVAMVNDSLDFEHALEQANHTVGDDGVFAWRGGVYAACTEEQWNSKSDAERQTSIDKVETDYSAEEVGQNEDVYLEEDGFVHVSEGDGHDYVFVNNERIALSSEDDVNVVGQGYGDNDDISSLSGSGIQGMDNAHVIYTSEDVYVVNDDEIDTDEIAEGEVVDMQTGDIYSQPVAVIQDGETLPDNLLVDEEMDGPAPEITPDIFEMESLQMDMQPMDDLQIDDGPIGDMGFVPAPDDF